MVDSGSRDGTQRTGRVSRRRFVQAAGASGVALGVAGCLQKDTSSGNGGGGGGDVEQIDMKPPKGNFKVQWAADSRVAEMAQEFKQALHDAGLPDNIDIEILAGSQVTDNRQSQYQQWLNAQQEQPELLMMDSGWTIPFIARGQVLNLSKALPKNLTKPVKDNYFQASVKTAQNDQGDLFGVPLFPDFPTMLYRKDLVEKAGYNPESENWSKNSISWQKFSKVVKDTMEQTGTKNGFTFQAKVYEGLSCCDFNEFMTSYGGAYFGPHKNLFGPIGNRPITVDEKPVIDSIKMVRTFIHGENDPHSLDGITGGISPSAVLQWAEDPSLGPFASGDAVAHRNWPYSIIQTGADKAFGKDLGVMPIPYGVKPSQAKYKGTGGPVAALGGWHITMNPNSPTDKKRAAAQVVKAMTQDSFKLKAFEILGWIPPEPKLLDSDRAKQVPVIGRYLEQLKVAGENAVPRPVTVVWPQQSGKIAQRVNDAYAQKATPQKAMKSLKSQLKAIENQQS